MKNILILANSEMVKHFVLWVGKSQSVGKHYYITCSNHSDASLLKETPNLSFLEEDPTSFLKLKNIMNRVSFSVVFIVMSSREEGVYSYRNVRLLYPKLRIIFVSKWDDMKMDDDNLKIININELLATHLYMHLPDVPIIAKYIGFGHGDIMEVLIPFGSTYAYRHVGSLSHRKWRIAAIYRDDKQILPNSATMIKPNDRLIIVGNHLLLEEVYKRMTMRKGLFPEPFGKNLYLIVDVDQDKDDILVQVNEAIFLVNQLPNSKLYIRVVHMNISDILEVLRGFETDKIKLLDGYSDNNLFETIDYDTIHYEVGLFLVNHKLFKTDLKEMLYVQKRAIYLFGETSLFDIQKAIVLMGEERAMESLSSSVFDLSEILGLPLSLCNYDPEGEFSDKKNIVEHYESLSSLYNQNIMIEERRFNPIMKLRELDEVLHIIPMDRSIFKKPIANFFSRNISHYFLGVKKHPQLLIPIEE